MENKNLTECNKDCSHCNHASYQCKNLGYPFGYSCIKFDAFIEVAKAGLTKVFFNKEKNK